MWIMKNLTFLHKNIGKIKYFYFLEIENLKQVCHVLIVIVKVYQQKNPPEVNTEILK